MVSQNVVIMMLYDLEIVALGKRQKAELEVAEVKMLRMDRILETARKEVKRKITEIYGCSERGHAVSWCQRRGCRG